MPESVRRIQEALAVRPTGTWNDCRRFLFQVAVPNITAANAGQVLELLTRHHELMGQSVWHFIFHAPWTEVEWRMLFRSGHDQLPGGDTEKARYRRVVETLRAL